MLKKRRWLIKTVGKRPQKSQMPLSAKCLLPQRVLCTQHDNQETFVVPSVWRNGHCLMLISGVMSTLHCTVVTVRGCLSPSLVSKCRHFCIRLWSWWKIFVYLAEIRESGKKFTLLSTQPVSELLRHMCRACFSLMKLHCVVRTGLGEQRLRLLSTCGTCRLLDSWAAVQPLRTVARAVVKWGGWIDWPWNSCFLGYPFFLLHCR